MSDAGAPPRSGLATLLLGRRLRTEEARSERIGPATGIPVLGLDALGSAAYGPEAALTVLLPLGVAAPRYMLPLTAVVLALLGLVALSYRQIIAAYPNGGGAYTVARETLGPRVGVLAAAALAIDYLLNVAVGISAGVAALVSVLPALLPHTLPLCLGILLLLTLVNLRGTREAGLAFAVPTYVFLACLLGALAVGIARGLAAHGRPVPLAPPALFPAASAGVSTWLLLRAFAAGCAALTGVEAVSNAVPLFKAPARQKARLTLSALAVLLFLLLAGVALCCRLYGVGATPPGASGYQSVLSQLLGAVVGRGVIYHVAMAAILAVLVLSANTSFAGFPQLCRLLAQDSLLPAGFAHRGRRLIFSEGVVVLAVLAGILLVAFGGITDRLIPLFAIGAFLAFTLSQLGMVFHWRRAGKERPRGALAINLIGASATGVTLVVIGASKFTEGAWVSLGLIPATTALLLGVRRYYGQLERELDVAAPIDFDRLEPPIVLVPLRRLDRVAHKGLRFAARLSPDVRAVQILADDRGIEALKTAWPSLVEEPARRAGLEPPRLLVISSSYREFLGPLLTLVRETAAAAPERDIVVIVPEVVPRRWYHTLLHNHRATLLRAALRMEGGPRVIVASTPWYENAG